MARPTSLAARSLAWTLIRPSSMPLSLLLARTLAQNTGILPRAAFSNTKPHIGFLTQLNSDTPITTKLTNPRPTQDMLLDVISSSMSTMRDGLWASKNKARDALNMKRYQCRKHNHTHLLGNFTQQQQRNLHTANRAAPSFATYPADGDLQRRTPIRLRDTILPQTSTRAFQAQIKAILDGIERENKNNRKDERKEDENQAFKRSDLV
ncbi:hypothetical protein OQA88_8585 [Cercophora sp. LCS_1]